MLPRIAIALVLLGVSGCSLDEDGREVPDVVGQEPAQARALVEAEGLGVTIDRSRNDLFCPPRSCRGVIVEQVPEGGAEVPSDARVTLRTDTVGGR